MICFIDVRGRSIKYDQTYNSCKRGASLGGKQSLNLHFQGKDCFLSAFFMLAHIFFNIIKDLRLSEICSWYIHYFLWLTLTTPLSLCHFQQHCAALFIDNVPLSLLSAKDPKKNHTQNTVGMKPVLKG